MNECHSLTINPKFELIIAKKRSVISETLEEKKYLLFLGSNSALFLGYHVKVPKT